MQSPGGCRHAAALILECLCWYGIPSQGTRIDRHLFARFASGRPFCPLGVSRETLRDRSSGASLAMASPQAVLVQLVVEMAASQSGAAGRLGEIRSMLLYEL